MTRWQIALQMLNNYQPPPELRRCLYCGVSIEYPQLSFCCAQHKSKYKYLQSKVKD